jgi:CDP-glycerol glycerophosphotransferase (TagB/SpsB family)
VVGNDTDVIPQWFINCANELGIPSVLIQDGLMFDMKIARQGPLDHLLHMLTHSKIKLLALALRLILSGKYHRITDGNSGCTQIHVWGAISESYYVNKGVDKKKIVITGRPKHVTVDDKFKKREDDLKTILYAPTEMVNTRIVTKDENEQLIDDLCSTVLSLDKIKLIIKPHTGENMVLYEKFKEKYGNKIEISNSNFYDLLPMSDIMITNISTTTIEALAESKPIIIFFPKIENIVNSDTFPRDLIKENIVLYAADKKSLLEQLNKIMNGDFMLSKNQLNEMLEKYLGPNDSDALLRSISFIEKLLNQ